MTYTDEAKNKKFSIFTWWDWETKTDIRLSNDNLLGQSLLQDSGHVWYRMQKYFIIYEIFK